MFAARRDRFLEGLPEDSVVLLLGASLVPRSNDTDFPFRQGSDFHYLTGFDHPNAAAVLRPGGTPQYTLFVEPRDRAAETWTGYRPGVEGAVRDYGADAAHPRSELAKQLPELIAGASRIYHVLGRDAAIDDLLVSSLDEMRLRSRAGRNPASEIVDPRSRIHEMRLFKEPEELDIMRRAAAITKEAHAEAARLAQPGRFEYELEAALAYAFRRRGATGPAYTSIVGGGRNATILHYIENDQPLVEGELLLIDAGCELDGYASDVTRTYPIGGRFEGAKKAVYDVVLAAQQASLEAAGPGATLRSVHDASVRALTEGMLELKLLEGDRDELIAREAYRRYYMHNTSHWLGLDVHDVGVYTDHGEPRPLEPGMVFTIEPGLYIADDDDEADASFRGIGVRIEDDVLITKDGIENLTEAIPKATDQVEAWVRG